MNKIKLLSLTNVILEYRIPVYNQLAEYFDVTVAHFGVKVNENKTKFKQIILTKKKKGPFIFFKEDIFKLASEYEAVIALGEFRVLPFFALGFKKREFSLTYWGIGVSASYDNKFDEDRRWDKIRFYLMNKADSIVFYTSYPIKRYVQYGGIKREKLFVANNTVDVVEKIEIPKEKKHFLFVGTLYKAKKIFDLLEAYNIAFTKNPSIKPLIIIGDGEEYDNICNWIAVKNLSNNIQLIGAIYDQNKLKNYYTDAIACISPGQAGLTLLNSMAYGVPFVTTSNAITGGEIFNIKNNVNGIIYQGSIERLAEIIEELSKNKSKVLAMAENAQNYYFTKRTMPIMVKGLVDAINYAIKEHKKA